MYIILMVNLALIWTQGAKYQMLENRLQLLHGSYFSVSYKAVFPILKYEQNFDHLSF